MAGNRNRTPFLPHPLKSLKLQQLMDQNGTYSHALNSKIISPHRLPSTNLTNIDHCVRFWPDNDQTSPAAQTHSYSNSSWINTQISFANWKITAFAREKKNFSFSLIPNQVKLKKKKYSPWGHHQIWATTGISFLINKSCCTHSWSPLKWTITEHILDIATCYRNHKSLFPELAQWSRGITEDSSCESFSHILLFPS